MPITRFVRSIIFFIFFLNINALAQSPYSPLDPLNFYRLERFQVLSGRLANEFHSNVQPFERQAIAEFAQRIEADSNTKFSSIDKFNLNYIKKDNWEFGSDPNLGDTHLKGIFKYVYKKESDMYYLKNEDFDIHASPILGLNYGTDTRTLEFPAKKIYTNTRGVEIRGRLNSKLGFYTMISDNQEVYPNFVSKFYETNNAIPYQAFVKIKNQNDSLLRADYFNALAYITFNPIKSLNITFGNDKLFIGSGIRSLVISDFSPPFLQFRAKLKIKKFQYLYLLGRMTNTQVFAPQNSSVSFPPKFINFHHLNVNFGKNVNVGLFEVVMFGKRDYGFELSYLNPVIFSRYLEGFLGSTDNAIVGADFKVNLFKTISTYGQFYLDEYNKAEFKKYLWWSKKYAWQLGINYYNVMKINNLDLQAEYNYVRPYMYTHFTTFTNYVNYSLPIAHPLGANFTELLLVLRYQPIKRLYLTATQMFVQKGEDMNGLNYGGNILKDNSLDKPSIYGVQTHQGFLNKISFTDINVAYMIRHNFFLELNLQIRKDSYFSKAEFMPNCGLRWNMPRKLPMF